MSPIDGVTLYTQNLSGEQEKLVSLTSVPHPAEIKLILN